MSEETTTGRVNWQKLRPVLIGIAALAVAAVLLTGFGKPGFLVTRELDVAAVDTGVREILSDPYSGYGLGDVADVHCNGGKNPVIKPGATFNCDTKIAGAQATVSVTLVGDEGAYWVDTPR